MFADATASARTPRQKHAPRLLLLPRTKVSPPSTLPAMFHITRNPDGSIASVARHEQPGSEPMDDTHPELQQFLRPAAPEGFDAVDADFVRVLEDLIDTLIQHNVIRHTDLPPAAQRKLLLRKGLRTRMQGALDLLGDDGRVI